jgi:hypothetical protein
MTPSRAAHLQLSDEQVERFARQIIVPGIGADGQIRLCTAEVFVDGQPDGRRVATQYLRAAGVIVHDSTSPPPRLDCVVLAGVNGLTRRRLQTLSEAAPLLAWYTITGSMLRGGLSNRDHPLPVPSRGTDTPSARRSSLLHRIGGADVATTTMAALLGWIQPGDVYEVELR